MSRSLKGSLFALLAGIFWGVMSIFVKGFEKIGIKTMSLVFIRVLLTAVFMLIFLAASNPKLLKIKLKDLWIFIGNGILSLLAFSFCYFRAISASSAAVAAVLLYTAPVAVTLISVILFKERLTVTKIIACITALCGCVLTSGIIGSASFSKKGIIYGLLAGFCYALYSIFTRCAINKGYHPLTVITYSFSAALIGSLPFADIKNTVIKVTSDPKIFLFAVVMGFVSSVIPYLLYTSSLKLTEPSKASIIASIELVIAALTGFIAFGQSLDIISVFGILLVIAAILMLNPVKARDKSRQTG